MADVPPTRQMRLRPNAATKSTKSADEIKHKIALQMDPNNNDGESVKVEPVSVVPVKPKYHPVPIFAVKPKQVADHGRKWMTPERPVQTNIKTNPSLYDASKPVQDMTLNEESMFQIFNNLTLNELCNTAIAYDEMKLAAQKFFEVQYTKVNLAWLIDDGADKFTLLQAQRLLQCFGQFISTLIVNSNQLEEADQKGKLLEFIEQHCAGVLFWDSK
ncbi:uncharacterized protein LOC129568773 isoform X2 [Sitodiplosis mosellana]|uniref:uncharacterized protein LOC129568773 isoform X2 n=1 Tax=Sitodiplosis mosellana TaxID=263140 RepID=UPI002444E4C1|nr:uncharacterized protein LOC129568773 isoform X2 [Sitodiplosis mosellana]